MKVAVSPFPLLPPHHSPLAATSVLYMKVTDGSILASPLCVLKIEQEILFGALSVVLWR